MTGTVVQSGVYKLEIDTGWDSSSFVLDSATKGILDDPTYPLGPTTDFADVTDGVLEVSITRGRRDIGDQFVPGIMNFTLNDQIAYGAFNPFNPDSPTYDPANDQPGIAPLRRVRFYRYDSSNIEESLFQGFIVTYDYQFNLDGNDLIFISAIDDQYLLSQAFLDEWNVDEEIASTRVTKLLALSEVNAFQGVGEQSIETSAVTLGGASAYTVPSGTNAQGYLGRIMQAEQGRAFVDRSGVFTFQKRIGATLAGATIEFGDNDPAHTPYDSVNINFGADKVVNRASVTHAGATTPETAEDLASQSKYFIQAVAYTDSLVHNATAALDLANYLIVGEPTATLTSVTTGFQMLSNAERDLVATLEIGDTISVEKTIVTGPTTTSVIAQESFVEGIEHRIQFASGHQTTIYTSPTTVYQLFILGGYTTTTTRTNLVTNPSFEVDLSTWSTSGTVARTTAQFYSGVASASLTYAGSGTVLIQQSTRSTVTAGLTYTASFYLKQSVDAGSVICNFMWYNAAGSVILDDTHQTNNPNTAWQRFSQTRTAPANATSCSFRIYQTAGEGGGAVATVDYVDAVLVEQTSSALPYFDGTYADTYMGYTLTEQGWNGTADASTSTATWGLNSSLVTGSTLDTIYALS